MLESIVSDGKKEEIGGYFEICLFLFYDVMFFKIFIVCVNNKIIGC